MNAWDAYQEAIKQQQELSAIKRTNDPLHEARCRQAAIRCHKALRRYRDDMTAGLLPLYATDDDDEGEHVYTPARQYSRASARSAMMLTEEQRNAICDFYCVCKSEVTTADHFGVSLYSVMVLLDKTGIKPLAEKTQTQAKRGINYWLVADLLNSGMTDGEICRRFGVSEYSYGMSKTHARKRGMLDPSTRSETYYWQQVLDFINAGKTSDQIKEMLGINYKHITEIRRYIQSEHPELLARKK